MSSGDHSFFGRVLCKHSNSVSVQVSGLSLRDCGMLKNLNCLFLRTLRVFRFCLLLLWKSHRVFAQDHAQYDLFLFERQSCTGSVLRVPPSFLEYSLTVLSQHSERFQLLSTTGCRVFRIAFQTDQKTKLQTFSLAGQTSFGWSTPFPHSGPDAFQCHWRTVEQASKQLSGTQSCIVAEHGGC